MQKSLAEREGSCLILFDQLASLLRTAGCDATLCRPTTCQERPDTEQRPGILAVRPEGPLFYANIERLEAQRKHLCGALC